MASQELYALLPRKAPDQGYPSEIINAAEEYLVRLGVTLPQGFNWQEFISVMLTAAPESELAKIIDSWHKSAEWLSESVDAKLKAGQTGGVDWGYACGVQEQQKVCATELEMLLYGSRDTTKPAS